MILKVQKLFNYEEVNKDVQKDSEEDTKDKEKEKEIEFISDNILSSHKDDGGVLEKFLVEEDDSYCLFSDKEVKEIEWIWKPYIVKGNLNIIVGEGGVGKSYFTSWLVSSISNGNKIPFSEDCFDIGNSILQNAEDDIEATILPRLLSNDADVSKIGYFDEDKKMFSVKQIYRLESRLQKTMPSIVILDPIQAYIGDINMNSSVDVRNALKPLKILAEKYNCAIVLLMHLNKNTGTNKATNRVMGSYDFIASCRSAIMIESNPENPEEKLFIPIKTNLMKENEKNTLSFKINDEGKIIWLENKGIINGNEVLSENTNLVDKSSSAKGFILGVLSRGEIMANELKNLVINKGNISEKTYNIAKSNLHKEMKIDSYQKDKCFYWNLKEGRGE